MSTPHHWCEALTRYVLSINTTCAKHQYVGCIYADGEHSGHHKEYQKWLMANMYAMFIGCYDLYYIVILQRNAFLIAGK